MRRLLKFAAAAGLLLLALAPVLAQEEEERSALVRFVENRISSPTMQIRLNGIEGALSSDVKMQSITISDPEGVWLTIANPRMVWSRTALLGGRLEIESLTAERIVYARNPVPDESLPSPEATPFALPDLPVAVVLKQLSVPAVTLGEPVLGIAAQASVQGNFTLDGGSLDTNLAIMRTDGPGGEFAVDASYDRQASRLAIDIKLQEPQNGLVANLLGLEGRPPVALTVAGEGPIDDMAVSLAFDVDAQRILAGSLELSRVADGIAASADLGGPLGRLLPDAQRRLLGDESRLSARAVFGSDNRIRIDGLTLDSGAVKLQATAALLADGFLEKLALDATVAAADGRPVPLTGGENGVALSRAEAKVDYDAADADGWQGRLSLAGLDTGRAALGAVSIVANGTVSNPGDPGQRGLTFDLSGSAQDITSEDPALASALGERIDLDGSGYWSSGQPLTLRRLQVGGDSFAVTLAGEMSGLVFDGSLDLQAQDLEAFSTLAGRDLGGSASIAATGTVSPVSGGFDLNLDGVTRSLSIGDAVADPLLEGDTVLKGGVARTEEGLSFRQMLVENPQLSAKLDGSFASQSSSLDADILVRDIGKALKDAAGALRLQASLQGATRPYAVRAAVTLDDGRLAGKPVRGLAFRFDGSADGADISGNLSGGGTIGGEAVTLAGGLSLEDGAADLRDLAASIGATKLSGSLKRSQQGLLNGSLTVRSTDIGALAALANTRAKGSVEGDVTLASRDGAQSARADISARQLAFGDYAVSSADIQAAAADLFGTPRIDADIDATGVSAGGVTARSVKGDVSTQGDATRFDVTADLARDEARARAAGTLVQSGGLMRVTLDALSLQSRIANAKLSAPATVEIRDGVATIGDAVLDVGGGRVQISGSAGETLDLTVEARALPLAIANAVQPGLGAAGTIGGTVRITGRSSDPAATFDISGTGLSARQLAEAGVEPVTLSARGNYRGGTVSLEAASARNAQGLNATASGAIPLEGSGLNVAVRGAAPLSIAEPVIGDRGTSLDGTAQFDVSATGSISDPQLAGSVSVEGATIADPLSNLRLENVRLAARLSGDTVTIGQASARLSAGGSVSATGSVGISGGLPADLTVNIDRARYSDGQTFSTTVSGNLRMNGELAVSPLLAGTVELSATEIAVPENFGSSSALLDVEHVRPGQEVERTLDRLGKVQPAGNGATREGGNLRVDVTVRAPNQIFVRGRGLDAELGGQVRVTGPVDDVQPVGRFELRRGRLSILGQRIELTEGAVTLSGDLDPQLDLVATTRTSEVEAYIRISGHPSDPQVTFSSNPELPQDEVLAQIIFGRSVSNLSAVQVARLASAAAELAGGRNTSVVDSIRRGVGVDDLDVVEDAQGNAAVRAGKYVSDNVYLGVQSSGAQTETTIDLDLTDNVKARGSLSSEGESGVGIFFEKDF